LSGDYAAALAAADAAEAHDDGASTPSVRALLHRVRAYAQVARGNNAAADEELTRSLHVARESDALYEIALSLLARGRIRGDDEALAEAKTIFESLHVVEVTEPPQWGRRAGGAARP